MLRDRGVDDFEPDWDALRDRYQDARDEADIETMRLERADAREE